MMEMDISVFIKMIQCGKILYSDHKVLISDDLSHMFYEAYGQRFYIMSMDWFTHHKSFWAFDVVNPNEVSRRYT